MLTVNFEDNKNTCFKFIGMSDSDNNSGGLISNNTSLIFSNNDCGEDSCSFYSGPSNETIMAFGENGECCGSIAYSGAGEACGSIAYSGSSESCGSVSSSFSGSCSSSSSSCICTC